MRLADGEGARSGRVEVFHQGEWGTVCDQDWDLDDAAVVCRQLGFKGALKAEGGSRFGPGQGDVMMKGMACQGSEARLMDCPSLCWEAPGCNHTQDAGVVCLEGEHQEL